MTIYCRLDAREGEREREFASPGRAAMKLSSVSLTYCSLCGYVLFVSRRKREAMSGVLKRE